MEPSYFAGINELRRVIGLRKDMDKVAIEVCSVIAQHDDRDLHFALLNMLKEFGLQ